jgi:pectinesterase
MKYRYHENCAITMKFLLLSIVACSSCLAVRAQQHRLIVAKDGSGNYTTVQAAIDAAPDFSHDTTVIYIKDGVYKERVTVPASKRLLKLVGENADSVILTFDNYASRKNIFGENMGTSGSSSFYLFASAFTAENITFRNTAGPVGQALAIFIAGDKAKFVHCRFLGFQDTIYTYGKGNSGSGLSREYFSDCYIKGATDFIFGSATAVFDHCTVFCARGGHYITAASTSQEAPFGYVFLHCTITGDAPDTSFYLGRPWRPYAKVVYLECRLGPMIKPEGWFNWNKASNERTAYYAEYKSSGPGAAPGKRVGWSHQLDHGQAAGYTLKNIFGDWTPAE